ncbi:hypothetical protein CBR_g25787 [Chara braunii]|uniref:DUF4360 domain-containing protein n=1 Tax=Chara braunii TaxID=69332 RepID=A0A388L6C6_CHABU|nr:hypothetical protein CBR_g25787 [Chara braunii]|eukprot:GBG77856.1 hypothetical protein CBR_g25787 [Chara braunii]
MAAMVVLLFLGLFQLAVPGLAQSPPSGTVKIQGFTYGGTGCPPGSAAGAISADGKALTLIFSNYTVLTLGNPADRRKNCQVAVNLSYPVGFTFTLGAVTFRGYASFEEGVTGALAAAYYMSGVPGTVRVLHNLPPPANGDFEITDQFALFLFAQCGESTVMLNINSEARVVAPLPPNNNKKGLITVDTQDLKLEQQFGLRWKSC